MPDKKLTDNEIIKALEIFVNSVGKGFVFANVDIKKDGINDFKHIDLSYDEIFDLINRLQAKVIKEQNKNSKLRNERNRLQAEIERLKIETNGIEIGIKIANEKVKNIAYKELADEFEYEILHKEFWNDHPSTSKIWLNGYEQCLRDMRVMLKDKVKEMVGDNNA